MTEPSLEFMYRILGQNEQILNEMVTIREDIEIMSAMLRRMESWMHRTDDRIRRLEDRTIGSK
jgi:hypothetical protein